MKIFAIVLFIFVLITGFVGISLTIIENCEESVNNRHKKEDC